MNFSGWSTCSCWTDYFRNTEGFESQGNQEIQAVSVVHMLKDRPTRNGERHNRQSGASHGGWTWPAVFGGDQDGFKRYEQNWSGTEAFGAHQKIQR